MKIEEYRAKQDKIQKDAKRQTKKLIAEYAMSNNTVKIGDVVSNGIDTIIVDQIQATASFLSDRPSCVYSGPKITKSGKPFKSGARASVYQTGIVTK